MKIYAPNADYTGVTAGVAFANGVAEVEKNEENEARLQWFEQHGFGMGSRKDADDQRGRETPNLKGSAMPLSQLTREELNEVAAGKGIVGASSMSKKDEVIEAIKDASGADSED